MIGKPDKAKLLRQWFRSMHLFGLFVMLWLPVAVLAQTGPHSDALSQGYLPGTGLTVDKQQVFTDDDWAFLSSRELSCAMAPNWPPINMYDQDKKLVGIAIDYWEIISKNLNIDIQCDVKESFSEVLQAIKARQADFMLATSITDERKQYAQFSKPYVSFPIAIATTIDKGYIPDESALTGKRVAVGRGYSAYQILRKENPGIHFVEVDNTGAGMKLLARNEVFAVVDNLPVLARIINDNNYKNIKVSGTTKHNIDVRLMVRNDYPQLAVIFNKAIDLISEEDRQRILSRWLDQDVVSGFSIALTEDEKNWLAEKHTVRVRTVDWAPYLIVRDNEAPQGIAVEYLKSIEKRTGIKFEYEVTHQPFAGFLESMKQGQGPDLTPVLVRTPEREQYLSFTENYISSPYVIFAREQEDLIMDISALTGKTVAVPKGFAVQALLAESFPEMRLLLVDSDENALQAVATGQADAYIGNLTVSSHIIHRRGFSDLRVVAPTPFGDHTLSMGNRKDWPELTSIINKALSSMTEEERTAIRNKYLSVRYEHGIDRAEALKWLLIFVGAASGIVLSLTFWNRSLKHQVHDRTAELEGTNRLLVNEIDERKLGQEKMRYQATLLENVSDAVVSVDPDFKVVSWNQAAERIYGWNAEEAIGRVFREVTSLEYLRQRRDDVLADLKKTGMWRGEVKQARKDGEQIFVQATVSEIKDDQGRLAGFVGVYRDITEQKETQALLAEREKRFRATFEQAAVGIAHVGLEGRFLRINQKFCAITGYSQEEMLKLTFQDITHPEDLEKDLYYVKELLDGAKNTYSMEKRYLRKDNEIVWINLTGSLLRDETGTPSYFVAVIEDISGRKRGEVALRESEKNLIDAQKLAHIGNWVWDIKMNRITCSDEVYRVCGIKPNTTITYDKLLEAIHPEDRDYHDTHTAEWLKNRGGDPFEYRVLRPDGSIRYIFGIGEVECDDDGEPVRMIGTLQDITERKKSQEALRESEEKFRSLMEQSPLSIQVLNLDGQIIRVNEAWKELWGISEEDLPEALEKYNMLEDEEARKLGIMPLIEKGFKGESVIMPVIEYDASSTLEDLGMDGAQGNKRWIQGRLYPIRNSKGKVVNVVDIEEDITERKKAEGKVQDYQQRLKALASQLTLAEERERRRIAADLHDHVGQSLALARIQLARARKTDSRTELDATLDEISESMRHNVQGVRELVFDLSPPMMNEVGLAAAISDWLDEQIGKRYGLKTEFVDDGRKKPLDNDVRVILFRNMKELLLNVVKHAQASHVKVTLDNTENRIRLVVQDDGIGFDSSAALGKVKLDGGFGLFSIQERMEGFGGSLEIVTEPGKGCKAVLVAPFSVK